MTIYDRIDMILKERKISRRKLARQTGIPESTLASAFVRRPEHFPTKYIQAIAAALDVSWQELVAGTDLQGQAACAIDGYTSIKTVNGKTYFNGVEITTGSDPHKQAHIELLHRQVEQLDDDTLRNLSKVADEMRQLPVSAQEEIVRFSKFRRKEMESNR